MKKEEHINDSKRFVVFLLDGEKYGINISRVHGVERMLPITEVPKAPGFVEGVANLRGDVVPIVSLRKRLGMDEQTIDDSTRVVLVEDQDDIVGLVVDSVSQVVSMPLSSVEESNEILGDVNMLFVCGVGQIDDEIIVVLDAQEILNAEVEM